MFIVVTVAGVVQGIVTGIRGLCNGIGPALFGLVFYVFHVHLDEDPTAPALSQQVASNHTWSMKDPFDKVEDLSRLRQKEIKGMVYQSFVRTAMLYGSET